jgi:hypothetical protein
MTGFLGFVQNNRAFGFCLGMAKLWSGEVSIMDCHVGLCPPRNDE